MKVLDVYTGKTLFMQQFPRNQKLKIIRENSTNQRYVSILLGKKNFFVYDLQENKFLNDISSIFNKLNLDDELLISEEQLSVIMKSFLSLIKDKPVYDLRKYKYRVHIIDGLFICLANIDEVVHTIKSSNSTADAKAALMKNFLLTALRSVSFIININHSVLGYFTSMHVQLGNILCCLSY